MRRALTLSLCCASTWQRPRQIPRVPTPTSALFHHQRVRSIGGRRQRRELRPPSSTRHTCELPGHNAVERGRSPVRAWQPFPPKCPTTCALPMRKRGSPKYLSVPRGNVARWGYRQTNLSKRGEEGKRGEDAGLL